MAQSLLDTLPGSAPSAAPKKSGGSLLDNLPSLSTSGGGSLLDDLPESGQPFPGPKPQPSIWDKASTFGKQALDIGGKALGATKTFLNQPIKEPVSDYQPLVQEAQKPLPEVSPDMAKSVLAAKQHGEFLTGLDALANVPDTTVSRIKEAEIRKPPTIPERIAGFGETLQRPGGKGQLLSNLIRTPSGEELTLEGMKQRQPEAIGEFEREIKGKERQELFMEMIPYFLPGGLTTTAIGGLGITAAKIAAGKPPVRTAVTGAAQYVAIPAALEAVTPPLIRWITKEQTVSKIPLSADKFLESMRGRGGELPRVVTEADRAIKSDLLKTAMKMAKEGRGSEPILTETVKVFSDKGWVKAIKKVLDVMPEEDIQKTLEVAGKRVKPPAPKVAGPPKLLPEAGAPIAEPVPAVRPPTPKPGPKIVGQDPFINLKRDISIRDVHGDKAVLPAGEAYTPHKLSTGNILLKDGDQFTVSKNQYQNVKNQAQVGAAKPFAPELAETKDVVKGGRNLEGEIDLLLGDEAGEGMTRAEAREYVLQDAESEVATKFKQYTLPGGENYREVLIRTPEEKPSFVEPIKWTERVPGEHKALVGDREFGIVPEDDGFYVYEKDQVLGKRVKTIEQAKQVVDDTVNTVWPIKFRTPHWDEPNVLSHLRMNDRITPDGKKVLFIEEMQSDWAAKARKEGVEGEKLKVSLTEDKIDGKQRYFVEHPDNPNRYPKVFDAKAEAENYRKSLISGGHPLLKNWQDLTLKRALKEAVDGGYDYLAWTSGEQQAGRYDLSKQISKIDYYKTEKGNYNLSVSDKQGKGVLQEAEVGPSKLEEYVGKEPARKIIEDEKGSGVLSGLDLKIGGEWAKNLYDKEIPVRLGKLTGQKAETVDLGVKKDGVTKLEMGEEGFEVLPGQDVKQQAIPITPQVKAMVAGEVGPGLRQPSGKAPELAKKRPRGEFMEAPRLEGEPEELPIPAALREGPVEFYAGLPVPSYVKKDVQKVYDIITGKTKDLPYDWTANELKDKPVTVQYLPDMTPTGDKNIDKIMGQINQRMDQRRVTGKKKEKLAAWRDVRFGLQDMEEKTGVPVYQVGKDIMKAFSDVRAEMGDHMEALFEGTGLKPAEVVASHDMQDRIAQHIAKPDELMITPLNEGEIKLANNIKKELETFEPLVKQIRHDRWMRTGEMPRDLESKPDGLKIMEEGREIYRSGDMEAYKKWIEDSDFGVREAYLPGMPYEGYLDPTARTEKALLGKGFTKTRKGLWKYDPERPLLKEVNKYVKRSLSIEKIEPKIKDLYQMMRENKLLTPENRQLLDNWTKMLLGRSFVDPPGRIIKKTASAFWKAKIPQLLAKWIPRNLMQNTVNVLPKLFRPFSPTFWKNLPSLYSGFTKIDIFAKNRALLKDPEFMDFFRRYVSSLDALGREYFFMEGGEFETVNRISHLLSEISKAYSWSDTANRTRALVDVYSLATDTLKTYRANPTAKNFNEFLDATGAQYLEDLELVDILRLVAEGNDKQAALQLGKVMADNSHFMYKRAFKGLAEQGETAQAGLTIFTFAKGTAQDIGLRGIKPFLDWSRATKNYARGKGPRPSARTTKRAYNGIRMLLGWYLASLAANKVQERVFGLEQGSYGLGTLRWIPGGVFIATWMRLAEDLWKAVDQRKGWDYALSQTVNSMGRNFVPFYDITMKSIAAQKGVARYSPPLDIRNKIREWSGTHDPARQKKWVERETLEQMQYIFFGGSGSANAERLTEDYFAYIAAMDKYGPEHKRTEAKKKELERSMRLYPVVEAKKDIPRQAEFIEDLYPTIKTKMKEKEEEDIIKLFREMK